MTSKGAPLEPAGRHIVSGSRCRLFAAAVLLTGLVTGCSAPEARTMRGSLSVQSSENPAASPSTTAAPVLDVETANLTKTMESVLTGIASDGSKPAQETIRNQLVSAGIPASTLEVSASRTPTGLDVDSIEAAARLGEDCVIGQIRGDTVTTVVLPVLANGKCFAGDSH